MIVVLPAQVKFEEGDPAHWTWAKIYKKQYDKTEVRKNTLALSA